MYLRTLNFIFCVINDGRSSRFNTLWSVIAYFYEIPISYILHFLDWFRFFFCTWIKSKRHVTF